jgi:DNA-binding GntR family transcriptional regulator
VTKQQYVHTALRQAIVRCELKPGERLVIDDLARRLKTSIIPVREALRLLESEGLVVSVAHVGTAVAALSRQSIVEVFALLEGLETVSARAAAEAAGEDDLQDLRELVAAMDRALDTGRQSVWANLNTRFHTRIGELCGMPMIDQMLRRAFDHWDRVRRHFFRDVMVRRAEVAQREHHAILEHLHRRDLDALERTVREHNRGALAAYLRHLDANGERTEPQITSRT